MTLPPSPLPQTATVCNSRFQRSLFGAHTVTTDDSTQKPDLASMDTTVHWEYVVKLAACYAVARLFISRARSVRRDETAGSPARTLRAPLLIVDAPWSPH